MPKTEVQQVLQGLQQSGLVVTLILFGMVLFGINVYRGGQTARLERLAVSQQLGKRVKPRADVARAIHAGGVMALGQEASWGAPLPVLEAPRVTYTPARDRNPFEGPLHQRQWEERIARATGQMQAQALAATMPGFTVQGVFWGGPKPYAIINDRPMRVGESFEGIEVVRIAPGQVVLQFEDAEIEAVPGMDVGAAPRAGPPRHTPRGAGRYPRR